LLLRHGGHARAAGFTLANENLPAFRERLLGYGAEHLDETTLARRYSVDALVKLDELTLQTPVALALLAPFGEGNPEPALSTVGLKLLAVRAVGQEGKHLKLEVAQGTHSLPAIAFRQGRLASELARGDTVDLIYRPDLNEWQGETTLQLVVSAIRPSRG
jgi:single-stranded-DNA-specific exonuclease